jgi:hypothetical protein
VSEIVAHQLADEVSVLRAEIERLRAVLRLIIAEYPDHEDMLDIASEALKAREPQGPVL